MDKELLITTAKNFIKEQLGEDSTSHDYWHSLLVWRNAKNITAVEQANPLIVELASLLHDVGDWKFQENTSTEHITVKAFLEQIGIEE